MSLITVGNGIKLEVELNGETYTMSQSPMGVMKGLATRLTMRNLEFVKAVQESIPEGPERKEALKPYLKLPTQDEVLEFSRSIEGGMYSLYLGFKQNHPKLTYDQFESMMTAENMAKVNAAYAVLNGVSEEKSADKSEGNAPVAEVVTT